MDWLTVVLAYLLGSVSGSLVLGRLKRVDIRTLGSGNAGGTNAFRTQGLLFALGVVIWDVGKGVLAAGWLPSLVDGAWPGLGLACGLAAVVGHCFPLWHGFRGGKGGATAVGVIAVVQPWLLLPVLLTWCVTLAGSGYVSLATVLAGISLVPGAWWLGLDRATLGFALALAAFMTFTHRQNLRRLARGEEYRFQRARLVHWFRRGH